MFDTYILGVSVGMSTEGMPHAAIYIHDKSRHQNKNRGTMYYAKYERSLQRFRPESDMIFRSELMYGRAPDFATLTNHPLTEISQTEAGYIARIYRIMASRANEGDVRWETSYSFVKQMAHMIRKDLLHDNRGGMFTQRLNMALGSMNGSLQPGMMGMQPVSPYMNGMSSPVPGYMPQMVPPMSNGMGGYGGSGYGGPRYGHGRRQGYGRDPYDPYGRRHSCCTIM